MPPLKLVVDDTWVAGDGYRPVRVRISPQPTGGSPSPRFRRDRQVTLEIQQRPWNSPFPSDVVSKTIDLPEGAAEVTETILYRQNRIQNTEFIFWEGRQTRRNVVNYSFQSGNRRNMSANPSILIVDFDVPNSTERSAGWGRFRGKLEDKIPNPAGLVESLPAVHAHNAQDDFGESWVDVAEQISGIGFMTPSDLPDDWLAYTGLDILYISLEDLRRLASERPATWAAIEAWARSGGNMWVAGVGADFERVDELERIFQLDADSGADSAKTAPATRWQRLSKADYGEPVELLQLENYGWVNGTYVNQAELKDPPKLVEIEIPILHRDLQLGKVVAFANQEPLSTKDTWQWMWIFKSLSPDRWLWSARHGFSPAKWNDGFWQYLIPGVGLSPVNAFRVIITLFALVIGPVNFVLLRRRQRLSWMLFTVPAAALLVTGGLLGYALLTDGLSVQSRMRSLTDLDQVANHEVIWSRQTYYAGAAPAAGITFRDDTAAYPVDHDAGVRAYQGGQKRSMNWDNGQHLRRGFLPSRTTSQLLTVQSRPTQRQLVIQRDAGQPLKITNQLGSKILRVLVRDHDQQYYWATNCAAGQVASLTKTTLPELTKQLQPERDQHALQFPAGIDIALIQQSGGSRRYGYWSSNVPDPESETCRMEQALSKLLDGQPDLEPGQYFAILTDNSELDVGVQARQRDHEFHVIHGRFARD